LRLVSHSNGIVGSNGNGDSNQPWISADGTVLCYLSASTNLDPAVDSDTLSDLYVATFDFSTVSDSVVISLNPAGIKGNGDVVSCQLAPDGNFAVFTTAASNMGVGVTNVMLRNLQTNQTTCMTLTSDGLGPNAPCQFPRVNSGGTRVVFTSAATNLTGFAGGTAQPYITVPGGGFELVSISDTGVVAASAGGFPSISSAGPWVVWVSAAANLVPPDSNGTTDIFARGPFGQ
jgi:hypothetical protein